MHLIIDGYNLLHVGRRPVQRDSYALQRERDSLIDQLASYRHRRPCEITVVFDGWQGGWAEETKERRRGIELIFSKLGEKADEVIKRLAREKGAGAIVVTSDREVERYAERTGAAVIASVQFREKMERPVQDLQKEDERYTGEEGKIKKKGPSRTLSKKEKKLRAALKKI